MFEPSVGKTLLQCSIIMNPLQKYRPYFQLTSEEFEEKTNAAHVRLFLGVSCNWLSNFYQILAYNI